MLSVIILDGIKVSVAMLSAVAPIYTYNIFSFFRIEQLFFQFIKIYGLESFK